MDKKDIMSFYIWLAVLLSKDSHFSISSWHSHIWSEYNENCWDSLFDETQLISKSNLILLHRFKKPDWNARNIKYADEFVRVSTQNQKMKKSDGDCSEIDFNFIFHAIY